MRGKHVDEHGQEDLTPTELAHQQALQYGKDLARIYVAEKAKREELQIAYQQLSAIFTSTPAGLVVLDDAFHIQKANSAFCKWVEQTPDEVVGKPIEDVLVTDQLVLAIEQMAGAPVQIEFTVQEPALRVFQAHIARLQSRRSLGWIVVLNDQSERRQLDYQKMEFINIAAHELRTPMAPILGYSLMLLEDLEGQLDEMHWEFIRSIYKGANRLQHRIDELVTFANLNRGEVWHEVLSAFTLVNLVNDVIDEMEECAAEKDVSLEVALEDQTITFSADAASLRVALHQLVLNGINFNVPGGTVRIEAHQTKTETIIHVIDTGIGIPQAEIEAIFQPFFQIEDHKTRQVGGLGLGLPMAQRAVTRLGGKLSVESTLGEGTVFTIRLPTQQAISADRSITETLPWDRVQQVRAYFPQLQAQTAAALSAVVTATESRSPLTRGHAGRVTALTLRIAEAMNYADHQLTLLETAAQVHDIGKVGLPEGVLCEQETFTETEQAIYRRHVTLGSEILASFDFMQAAIPIIASHHERWDGKGFPKGRIGKAIPLGGRILAVANGYDNQIARGVSSDAAIENIKAQSGRAWDPAVVTAFLKVIDGRTA